MTAEAFVRPEVTDDLLFDGRVRLLQPRRGHRAGTDAVFLAERADIRPGDDLVDLGSASGAVALGAAARVPGLRLTLVERDPDLSDLARENVVRNGLSGRAEVRTVDLFSGRRAWRGAGLRAGEFDVVVTNPPFFDAGERGSPDPGRRAAHVLEGGDLTNWLSAAAWLLKRRGRLCLIHRADRLEPILEALRPAFGSIEVLPVYTDRSGPATRILVSAVKGGRAPLRIATPIVLESPPAEGRAADPGFQRAG